MRDQPPMRYYFSRNMALHFYIFVPPMKKHSPFKTTFYGSVGWYYLRRFTLPPFQMCALRPISVEFLFLIFSVPISEGHER